MAEQIRTISTFKASPVRPDKPVPALFVSFDHEPPEPPASGSLRHTFGAWRKTYEEAATELESALFETLPGGLYDQILCAMLARKASLLKVTHAG